MIGGEYESGVFGTKVSPLSDGYLRPRFAPNLPSIFTILSVDDIHVFHDCTMSAVSILTLCFARSIRAASSSTRISQYDVDDMLEGASLRQNNLVMQTGQSKYYLRS
jgi:hypothetical protein